jgi:ubiquinone/menaquinone biosynthesis C-methylase UbiE
LISEWRIDDQTVEELDKRLRVGMRTVETGAGLSTIVFAANGCRHTCIVPDQALVDRIVTYCQREGVDHSSIEFVIAKSRDVVYQLTPGAYDIALLDGLHGFPTAYVDFCYLSVALRRYGVLLVDDMHIHTCRSIAEFMESDACWRVEILTSRFVLGVKMDDTGGIDGDWGQPFVFDRSAAGKNVRGVWIEPSERYLTAFEPELLPTPDLMRTEGIQTLEEWFRWAEQWVMVLKAFGGIGRNSRMLEVGCGLGRIAFPLRFELREGSYDGCDACTTKIDYLCRRFAPRYPHFRFHHADVSKSNYKRPTWLKSANCQLPGQDNAFDIVCAASVFTHLLPEAARNCFHEIGRVLHENGRAVIGAFLLDNFRRDRPRPLGCDKQFFDFHHFPDPAFPDSFAVPDPNNRETLTAYKQQVLIGFAAEAGLELVEPSIPGSWSGATDTFLLVEDLLVFRNKRDTGAPGAPASFWVWRKGRS